MIGDGGAEERDEGEQERPLNTRASSGPAWAMRACGCGCLASWSHHHQLWSP